jgi:hypothetical protein
MAVLKEFRCLAHGPFDSKEAVCPHGCSVVVREFRTAPAGRSAKTKTSDAALERLASRFGLSDMSNRDGSVGGSRKNANPMQPYWSEMPKGNTFEVGKGEVAPRGGNMVSNGGASAALAGLNITESVAAQMGEKYGGKFEKEPGFMDIAKSLPPVRAVPQGREPGSPQDFDRALKSAT